MVVTAGVELSELSTVAFVDEGELSLVDVARLSPG